MDAGRPGVPDADALGWSRRRFLAGAGLVAGAVVAGHTLSVWGRPVEGAAPTIAPARRSSSRIVVIAELAGGNDALDTVIPFADPRYRSLRPTLAPTSPLALDETSALHPRLVRLAERYRSGQVAIVEGVGVPDNDLSHFASLATWWSGRPGDPGATGWLGRHLDRTVGFDDPLAGVVIGPGPSPALTGAASFTTSIADARGLTPRGPAWLAADDALLDAWADMGRARGSRRHLEDEIRRSVAATDEARTELARAFGGGTGDAEAADPTGPGEGTATAAFAVAARLVTGPRPPQVVYLTDLGDFDTHEGQAGRRAALMGDLDAGIDAFLRAVEAAGRADDVIVVTVSEFGRRAQENGNGTDHGNAGTHFVVGAPVAGGRYGRPTSLGTLDARGNLPVAVDYRDLYATVLGWLDADPEAILGPGFTPQDVFTT